jgi:hypothetical protein
MDMADRINLLWTHYPWELAGLVLAAVYIVKYFKGRADNMAIAQAWHYAVKDVFARQFAVPAAYVDHNGNIDVTSKAARDERKEGEAVQEDSIIHFSANCFKYYCSGRRAVSGMMATLDVRD